MLIRLVREEDIPVCGEIYSAAFAEPPYREEWQPELAAEMLSGLMERDPDDCWCIEMDGEIAGFAFCTVFGKFRATIQELSIAPKFQKRGLGTALMDYALSRFKEKNIRTVDLVAKRDAPAFRMYRKFGFHRSDRYILMDKWL